MKRVMLEIDFELGETVYLSCDDDCDQGIITRIVLSVPENISYGILYGIAWGSRNETQHFAAEISREPCPKYPKPQEA